MKRREDPTRDPASEARDDWADEEEQETTDEHERFTLGLTPVGCEMLPTETDDQAGDPA